MNYDLEWLSEIFNDTKHRAASLRRWVSCYYNFVQLVWILNRFTPHVKVHVYWSNVSPLRGEKPIFGPLSRPDTAYCGQPVGNKEKTSHLYLSITVVRRTIPTPHRTWHDDRGGASHFCTPLTFSDPISSFAARCYWKFADKCHHRRKTLITGLPIPESDQI